MSAPSQPAEDAQGNPYVANRYLPDAGTSKAPAILVFTPGASGYVVPTLEIVGPVMTAVLAMTVDQVTGKIFVFDEGPQDGASSLIRFPPGSNGDQQPFAVSPFDFGPAVLLASVRPANI